MSHSPAIFLAPAILAIAACTSAGGIRTERDSPFAPGLSGEEDQNVDGLIVGHRLMQANEYELALRAYYRAWAEQGVSADVLSATGSANLKLGRLGQAERDLRQALVLDEEFIPAWNNLGVVLMEKGDYGEASRVFQRALKLDSGETADIADNLALALARIDNPDYADPQNTGPALVRRGTGEYLLLTEP